MGRRTKGSLDQWVVGPQGSNHIHDVLSLNNPKFWNYINNVYPAKLKIKHTTDADHRASYI